MLTERNVNGREPYSNSSLVLLLSCSPPPCSNKFQSQNPSTIGLFSPPTSHLSLEDSRVEDHLRETLHSKAKEGKIPTLEKDGRRLRFVQLGTAKRAEVLLNSTKWYYKSQEREDWKDQRTEQLGDHAKARYKLWQMMRRNNSEHSLLFEDNGDQRKSSGYSSEG